MINEAINNDYLTKFQDPTTYLINQPLHQVLKTLYERYGFARRQDLKTVERDVENMQYDLTQSLTVVWKAINDLQQLATAAKIKYSDEQLVDLGLAIIKVTYDFEHG